MNAVSQKRAKGDVAAVASAIHAACELERAGQRHGEIGRTLAMLIGARRDGLVRQFARGDFAARRMAEVVAVAIGAIYDAGAAIFPAAAAELSVAAIGGFGRGQLAPYSDVDLLFLHKQGGDATRPLLDYILYPLWDAGLKVGHSVHSPVSAIVHAQGDMVARTAFLDARIIAGPQSLFDDFSQRYEKLRKRTKKEFHNAKRLELEARHEESEQSRFLSEPNLKEGKGGLRDLQAIRWWYKYEYGAEIDAAKPPKRILTSDDIAAFQKCERFLWSLRINLHDLRGRADEKVSFDVQPALAEQLGYTERAGVTPAERLMRHYFVNAMEVGRLMRIFSAKLEEESRGLTSQSLKLLPKSLLKDEAQGKPNLKLKNGRLHFDSVAKARRNALDHFRLFRAFSKRPEFDFHPDALAIVSQSLQLVTLEARRDPEIAKVFLAALQESKNPVKMLRVMAETGLLGKYIPSIGKIIGRIEYGLYRRFSIDETIYQSIGILSEIAAGRARTQHPISTQILEQAKDRSVYYVTTLLHEADWSLKNKSGDSAERLIARVARRLGLDEADAALAGWAGARHAEMVRTVERRNLSEPEVISAFGSMVENRPRLDLLLVLSVCHFRVVGMHTWDDWTRRQLSELYEATCAWLEGGDAALRKRTAIRTRQARDASAALLANWSAEDRDEFLNRLSDGMYRTVDAAMIAWIADLARAAEEEGAQAAVAARLNNGDVETLVYADDRTGLLADLAGAVSAAGASVRSVQVMTTEDGKAVDVFSITSATGEPITDPEFVTRIHGKMLAAAKNAPTAPVKPMRQFGDRRAMFQIEPRVWIDLEASTHSVVIEAEGRDRPGLLHELTAALADIGVSIVSAHIATYGARAVDVFYVQDAPGYKITNKRRLQSIERRLLNVLNDSANSQTRLTL